MTIYTRTGDTGTTSLADGSRVSKEASRIEAYGTVDEANSWVGAARAWAGDAKLDGILEFLQHRLYNCSSNLATSPGSSMEPPRVTVEDIAFLERAIDVLQERAGSIRGFVLPGGSKCAGVLHVARTVCRRAERRIWALARCEWVDPDVVKFVNRASDLLFAAARYAAATQGEGDVLWDKDLPVHGL